MPAPTLIRRSWQERWSGSHTRLQFHIMKAVGPGVGRSDSHEEVKQLSEMAARAGSNKMLQRG